MTAIMKQIQRLRRADRAWFTAISVCLRLDATVSDISRKRSGKGRVPGTRVCFHIARHLIDLVNGFILLRHEHGHLHGPEPIMVS